ncbi:MAG: hypothetical protein PHT33_01475 [bacterium]|nr:hypothetical protein [bacterium]
MIEWSLEETELFKSRFRKYQKKFANETVAVLNNLDTYLKALNAGIKPPIVQAGFIHREPQGVIAIDQKGAPSRLRETRLYIYALEIRHIVYLITIGDKSSQKQDISDCRKFMNNLRKDDTNG